MNATGLTQAGHQISEQEIQKQDPCLVKTGDWEADMVSLENNPECRDTLWVKSFFSQVYPKNF